MKHCFLYLFLFAFHCAVFSQNINDSLNKAENIYVDNEDESIRILQNLRLNNFSTLKPDELARFYFINSKIKTNQLEETTALAFLDSAFANYNLVKNFKGLAQVKMNKGNCYFRLGEYPKALKEYTEGLAISEKHNLNQESASMYKNTGYVFLKLKRYDESLKFYDIALKLNEKSKDERNTCATLMNIGSVYFEKFDLQKSLLYNNKALIIASKLNDSINLPKLYNNIGSIYIEQGDTAKGFPYLLRALKIKERLNIPFDMIFSYDNVGLMYTYLKKYDSADYYLKKGLVLAQKLNAKNELVDLYDSYRNLYFKKGDFKKAYNYLTLKTSIRDSILNEDNYSNIEEIKTKFEVEKKNLELEKNKLEIKAQQKQNSLKNLIIISILIVTSLIGTSVFLYIKNRKKQQELKLEAELARQNTIHEKQLSEAEEKERRRIAQDLHDNMGAYTTSILAQIDSISISKEIPNASKVSSLRGDAENIMATLRETIWILKTKSISISHFMDLIKSYADKTLVKNLNFEVKYIEVITHDKTLSPSLTLNLYRIFQEVLQNIIKHSQASEVIIKLDTSQGIEITISDNGKGFDMNSIQRQSGLENMKYRAKESEFILTIDSELNKGTTIHLKQLN